MSDGKPVQALILPEYYWFVYVVELFGYWQTVDPTVLPGEVIYWAVTPALGDFLIKYRFRLLQQVLLYVLVV